MNNSLKFFYEAFDSLDHGKIFVRIFEVRRKLGWSIEQFDSILKDLRDKGIIQLHAGDNTSMTKDEIKDCFIDENGFIHFTMTWRKKI